MSSRSNSLIPSHLHRTIGIVGLSMVCSVLPLSAQKPDTPASRMERLDRGLVVIPTEGGYFASWRFFGTDSPETSFDLLQDGRPVGQDLGRATSMRVTASPSSRFQVITRVKGVPRDTSAAVTPWSAPWLSLRLRRPEPNQGATYTPNDCMTGDLDGDGQYEIIVKWDPSNSHDNSHRGLTAPVILDAYKLDGTFLWRVDLGPNIRAGAHYTQVMVYDLDGNGRAEMLCKTALGSRDGMGRYVNQAASDKHIRHFDNTETDRNEAGSILSGPEFLTVFEGGTGKALHTVYYRPNRAGGQDGVASYPPKEFWGDAYGNRSERYLACVAYLGGGKDRPSAVFCRGYYTRAYLWAVDWDGRHLSTRWVHASVSEDSVVRYDHRGKKEARRYLTNTTGLPGSHTAFGQGAHNLSVADVDGDGRDEITYGSAAIDDDGWLLYSTGMGHGDAQHLADLDPDRPGYEMFMVHEEDICGHGFDLRDARTGEVLLHEPTANDCGRGLCADIDSTHVGCEFTYAYSRNTYDIHGNIIAAGRTPSINGRIFWDGDPYEELLDGTRIAKWTGNGQSPFLVDGREIKDCGASHSCNGTKNTPCISADLFGDWREEVVYWSAEDPSVINIFSSTIPTDYRVPTLMHDHVYRMGIVWQNVAYNQPPHLGYYLPRFIESFQKQDNSKSR